MQKKLVLSYHVGPGIELRLPEMMANAFKPSSHPPIFRFFDTMSHVTQAVLELNSLVSTSQVYGYRYVSSFHSLGIVVVVLF